MMVFIIAKARLCVWTLNANVTEETKVTHFSHLHTREKWKCFVECCPTLQHGLAAKLRLDTGYWDTGVCLSWISRSFRWDSRSLRWDSPVFTGEFCQLNPTISLHALQIFSNIDWNIFQWVSTIFEACLVKIFFWSQYLTTGPQNHQGANLIYSLNKNKTHL